MKASEIIFLGIGLLVTWLVMEKTGLLGNSPIVNGIGTPTARPAAGAQSVVPQDDFQVAANDISKVLGAAFSAFGSKNDGSGSAQTSVFTL